MALDAKAATYDVVEAMVKYEQEKLKGEEILELFQYLIDTGMINHLQEHYGKMAEALLFVRLLKQA